MFVPTPRRDFLWHLGGGLGGIALTHLLGQSGLLADTLPLRPRAELNGGLHHPAKVRRVVQLFMNGGASQMDTFDHKPELDKRDGKKFDPGEHVEAPTSAPGNLMKSPFAFKQHGECGRWVSSVFPHLATCVDDIAFLMAMASKTNVHGPASYMMNTGFLAPGFPCAGAWISYGLGALSDNLPTFVVLPDPRGLPYNAKGNFTSGFLPMSHQGTIINAGAATPIPDLFPASPPPYLTPDSERDGLALLARANRRHAAANEGDSRLESRIASYELAARMQLSAPEALDLSRESEATRTLYGVNEKGTEDYGRRCLIARRLLERGVRAGLERGQRPEQQLGQPRQHPQGIARDRRRHRQADRGAAARSESARHVRRHARRLEHRVRPDAVHPGRDRPRPQRRHVRLLARRRGRQGWRGPRRERRMVVARP